MCRLVILKVVAQASYGYTTQNGSNLPPNTQFQKIHAVLCKITERMRFEGTSQDHKVQIHAQSRLNYSRLLKTSPSWGLNVSKDGDSITSLGKCSVILTVKNIFLMFKRNFLSVSLCPLSPVLSQGSTEKTLAPSSLLPPSDIYTHW